MEHELLQRAQRTTERATGEDGAEGGAGSGSAPRAAAGGSRLVGALPYGPAVQRTARGAARGAAPAVQASAAQGVAGPAGALPFLPRIQESFGRHDVGGVQAHVGGPAAAAAEEIGAAAYATGPHVAFAASPDLHTAAHEAAHVVQQRAGVQLAGGVGQEGDAYERHADAVASRVVGGGSAEALLDAVAPARGAVRESGATQRLVQRKGVERTLAQGSTGAAVGKLQQYLNAAGYEPPLVVDQVFGKLTKAAVEWYQSGHKDTNGVDLVPDGIVGPLTWGALEAERGTPQITNTQADLGDHVADRMTELNAGPHAADRGVHYDFNYKASHPELWKDDYSSGYADPTYFVRTDSFDWRLKPRMSASAAIKSWLRGLTIAECNSALIAIEIDAVRAALGDAKFDEHFGSADRIVPEDKRLRVKQGREGTLLEGVLQYQDETEIGGAGTFGNRPAERGDWCYFYNHPQYLQKHPGGAFQGENALCMGVVDGKQKWSGMGVDDVTEREMLDQMVGAYNQPRDEWDLKEIERIKADNGGTLPPEFDEKSGKFPLTLSSYKEILSAPEAEVFGEKRKGGFSPGRLRLNTGRIMGLQ